MSVGRKSILGLSSGAHQQLKIRKMSPAKDSDKEQIGRVFFKKEILCKMLLVSRGIVLKIDKWVW